MLILCSCRPGLSKQPLTRRLCGHLLLYFCISAGCTLRHVYTVFFSAELFAAFIKLASDQAVFGFTNSFLFFVSASYPLHSFFFVNGMPPYVCIVMKYLSPSALRDWYYLANTILHFPFFVFLRPASPQGSFQTIHLSTQEFLYKGEQHAHETDRSRTRSRRPL